MDMLTKLKTLSAQMDDPNFLESLSNKFEKFIESKNSQKAETVGDSKLSRPMEQEAAFEQFEKIATEVNEISKNFKGYSSNISDWNSKQTNEKVDLEGPSFNYNSLNITQKFVMKPFFKKDVA